ncbi:hypothetical protein MUK42_28773 [Musa troglodytarum]|uniref:Uncharacterized protein n=1 Tax=Musa troglodytarum TaxID=320322 RepID=A0A9E7GFG3_9LILI|nr:hypothetical protein MUK42_28773 [Musa troglodytarum]
MATALRLLPRPSMATGRLSQWSVLATLRSIYVQCVVLPSPRPFLTTYHGLLLAACRAQRMELPRDIRFSHAGIAFQATLVERAPAGTNAVCSLCLHSILAGYSFYATDPPNFQVHAECTRQCLSRLAAAATVDGRSTSFAPPDNSRSLNPGSHFGHSPSFPPHHLLYYDPYHYPSYYAQPHAYGPAPPPTPPPPHHGHWNPVFYAPAPYHYPSYYAQPHGYGPAPPPSPPPPPHHGASWNSDDNAPRPLPPPPPHHNNTWTTVTNAVQSSAVGALMQTLLQFILSSVLSN